MRIVSLILVASMIPFAGQSVYGASRAADAVEVGLSNAAVVHEVDTPLGPFVKLSIDQSLNKAKGSIVQRYNISSDKEKLVALTFDDGPSPHTTRILDILDKYKVKATFFLIGKNVDIYPDMAKAIASHGDAIGNHSYSHVPLRSMAKNELAADISAAEQSITNATGVRPKLFRPPFGAYTLENQQEIERLGYTSTLWTVDTDDWQKPGVPAIINRADAKGQMTSVILMHDMGVSSSETLEALPAIISNYKRQGYRFVTINQLQDMLGHDRQVARVKSVQIPKAEPMTKHIVVKERHASMKRFGWLPELLRFVRR